MMVWVNPNAFFLFKHISSIVYEIIDAKIFLSAVYFLSIWSVPKQFVFIFALQTVK